jgi:hypothetical protein
MKEFKGNGIYSFIRELDIYPLILLSDIVSINLPENIGHRERLIPIMQ